MKKIRFNVKVIKYFAGLIKKDKEHIEFVKEIEK